MVYVVSKFISLHPGGSSILLDHKIGQCLLITPVWQLTITLVSQLTKMLWMFLSPCMHRYEVLLEPQYAHLQINSIKTSEPAIIGKSRRALSCVLCWADSVVLHSHVFYQVFTRYLSQTSSYSMTCKLELHTYPFCPPNKLLNQASLPRGSLSSSHANCCRITSFRLLISETHQWHMSSAVMDCGGTSCKRNPSFLFLFLSIFVHPWAPT